MLCLERGEFGVGTKEMDAVLVAKAKAKDWMLHRLGAAIVEANGYWIARVKGCARLTVAVAKFYLGNLYLARAPTLPVAQSFRDD